MDPTPQAAEPIQQSQDASPQIQPDLGSDDDFGSLRDAIRDSKSQQPDPTKGQQPAQKPVQKAKEEAPVQTKDKPLKDKLKVEEVPSDDDQGDHPADGAEEDDIPTYKGRVPTDKEKATWKGLKEAKAEFDKIKPDYEKIKAEFEEFKKKPVFDEAVTKELEELRQFRDMTDFRLSDTYQNEIDAPMEGIHTEVAEIVSEFKLNSDALNQAFLEKSEWKRNLAIDKALKDADEEVPSGVAQAVRDNATQLHVLWKKEAEMQENAGKNRASYEHQKQQTVTKQTLEEQKAWQTAIQASTTLVETQMAPLLRALPEAQRNELMSALKESTISDSPEERALQAQAPHIAAVLIERLNTMSKEMSELKKANKALSGASPTTKARQPETKAPVNDDDDDGDSLISAIRARSGR